MIHTTGRPLFATRPLRRGLGALAFVLAGALALSMGPAQAIVDVSAVTLLDAEANPPAMAMPAASASARAARPQTMAGAASDALLASSSMMRAHTAAGAMPERGNLATALRRHIAVGGLDRSYLV